jgi:hypothetical protein
MRLVDRNPCRRSERESQLTSRMPGTDEGAVPLLRTEEIAIASRADVAVGTHHEQGEALDAEEIEAAIAVGSQPDLPARVGGLAFSSASATISWCRLALASVALMAWSRR